MFVSIYLQNKDWITIVNEIKLTIIICAINIEIQLEIILRC